jgi:CMP-N-acetylneuraminic acid synthetase
MSNNIAIIPARGGSKRIPRKNIIEFNGKPMIAWTIEAAINSGLFSKVLVSTDCEDIANISKEFGASVPFLRAEFADDITPVSKATCDALMQAEQHWGINFDIVTQLMANCPLRTSADITEATVAFTENNRDFQISCFKFGWMNPWWSFKLKEDLGHEWMFPEGVFKRSQDLDDLYSPTGSIWIARCEQLKSVHSFYGEGYKFQPMNWIGAVDIDDYDDLDFAKNFMSRLSVE